MVNASTVNAFKARLDKFRSHQSVEYDFTADLTGSGNRSEEAIIDQVLKYKFNLDIVKLPLLNLCNLIVLFYDMWSFYSFFISNFCSIVFSMLLVLHERLLWANKNCLLTYLLTYADADIEVSAPTTCVTFG